MWNTPANPNVLSDLKIDLTKIVSEEEFKKRQDSCEHYMMRFGPSYTGRYDGSYRKFDESICLKCGYNPNS